MTAGGVLRRLIAQPAVRRFPPPWTIDEANAACFIVKDATGHALAYVYPENEPGRRAAANLMTRAGSPPILRNCQTFCTRVTLASSLKMVSIKASWRADYG